MPSPRLAARAVIVEERRLLLVNAFADAASTLWCAPGGGVEAGTSLPENLRREVHEETGLLIEVGPPCLINEFHAPDTGFHQVEVFFRCRVSAGALSDEWCDPEGVVSRRRWVTRDEMAAYFYDRYAPDNMVLSVAGRVDFDRVCGLAETTCGDWSPTGTTRDPGTPGANAEKFRRTDESVSRGYLLGVAPGPAQDDDRRYAAMVLGRLLGGGGNSQLYWALVEEGIAEEALAEYSPHDGCGAFLVFASGEPDRLETFGEVIGREAKGLAGSTTETDLERIRNQVLTGETTAGERPEGRMQRLGRRWSAMGDYQPLEERLAKINAVTLDDLASLVEAYDPTPVLVGTLSPE